MILSANAQRQHTPKSTPILEYGKKKHKLITMKKSYVIGAIVIVITIIIVGVYFAFRSGTKSPAPSPSVDTADGINDSVDKAIKKIANDVEKSTKEGYISRREYMTSDPSQSLGKLTEIVLTNIMGKPIKAIIERDNVSGVLKVVMNGVDPKVFEPSLSSISDCVSKKIKTAQDIQEIDSTSIYNCTNDYFSKNGKEFDEKIVPAALSMIENSYNNFASENERKAIESRGGSTKAHTLCLVVHGTDSSPEFEKCLDSDPKTITWDKLKEIMVKRRNREEAKIKAPAPRGARPEP
jgi:uncharacterized protein YpmB